MRGKPSKKNPEGAIRDGQWKCRSKERRKQFTVKVSTVFEDAHLQLHKMLQAVYLLSKKGFSAHQLSRIWNATTNPPGFWLTVFGKQ